MTTPGDRDVVTWIGLGVVGAAAAVMSFTALADLARLSGITSVLGGRVPVAWLLPLTIDVLAAVSTRVWLRRRTNAEALRYARRSAWSAIAATVVGNASHGALAVLAAAPPWWAAVAVSAVPAVALGAMVHLAVLVGRGPDTEATLAPSDVELAAAAQAGGVSVVAVATPTWLYRLFDSTGDLLYVGITRDLTSRLGDHRRSKVWWSEVVDTQVAGYPTRAQALAVEQYVIGNESPRYNIAPGSLTDRGTRPAIDQPFEIDQRFLDSASTDEELVADLREWRAASSGPIGRDKIMTAYGIGATRAMRLKQAAERPLEAAS